ncbi:conditioned medium-induced protein 4 [Haloarchaeobius sp. DFWS5]|uniref:conditioned medium-induced protein 4 n=1 Tax=Haloarchaeobius sp. DFWS5 TaxID=3446114 RepID=UPI003EBD2C10
MDEKTEELRDIFVDVAGGDTVTEEQEESRGSLVDQGDVDERLGGVVAAMRERYDFRTGLADDELVTLLREYHRGASDTDLAEVLEVSERVAFLARLDCHLVRESDFADEVDRREFRERRDEGDDDAALAAHFETDEETVRRYREALEARETARAANDRYRDEFAAILADADLSGRLATDVHDTGLKDATEDIEPDSDVRM